MVQPSLFIFIAVNGLNGGQAPAFDLLQQVLDNNDFWM